MLFLSFIILLLLGWVLGKLATQFLDDSSSPVLQAKNVVFNASVAQGKSSYLFGKPDKVVTKVKKKPKVKTDEVKKTRLNLTLVGIIDMGEQGVALIKQSNKTLVVFEGEEILANVVLLEVYPEEIVISNRGVHERLSLVGGKNELLTKENSQEKDGNAVKQLVNAADLSQEESGALNEIGRALKKSPMSIAKFIKFKPVNKDGRWAGVKIWSKTDKKLFRAVGFKEGDMLVDVNGRSINQLASNPRLWQEFLKESQFELIVERNGQEHNVSVDLSGN